MTHTEPITETFARLKNWTSFAYRGCLVTRSGTGFQVGTVFCKDKAEVDAAINNRIKCLNESINRVKTKSE
jgi:hypothetical protein